MPKNRVGSLSESFLTWAERSASGEYASADLTAQADAIYYVKDVKAE